jgi:hypothetical protein
MSVLLGNINDAFSDASAKGVAVMRDVSDLRQTDGRCPVDGCHQHPWPYEAVTNRAVALASMKSPTLSAALISAIWGPDVADTHRACRAVVRESGQDVDWLLACGCSRRPTAVTEHKPTVKAVPNDTPCLVADYDAAVSAGFITMTERVGRYPAGEHELPHAFREGCDFCMKRRGGHYRLVLPQVVVYAVRYPDVPRVLVTDFPSLDAAWGKWGWDEYIRMSDEMMPIRHVPDVIDSLARSACGDGVTAEEREVLQVIACRLWWRSPWDPWEDGRATEIALDFVRDAEHCSREHHSSWS